MHQTQTLLSIGEFSRLTRLSHKALRLYAELNLLVPAEVDAASGYRSYLPQQAGQAERITLLRRLEVPLAEIRALLDAPPEEAALRLRHHWARRERRHREQRDLMPYLEQLLKGNDMPHHEVHERFVPARLVLSLTRRVVVPHVAGWIGEACGRLRTAVLEQGCTPDGEFAVLYHGQVDHENDGPVEVVLGFSGALRPSGELTVREEPAHRELYTTISLAQLEFPAILGAYDAVAAQVHARGLTCPLSPREVYFVDAPDPDPGAPFCHIAYPVTEAAHA